MGKLATMTISISAIPAFDDNYIWLLQQGRHVIVVDPGDATPVLHLLQSQSYALVAILITHYHQDHIGGVANILAAYPTTVYAPRYRAYPFPHQAVGEGHELHFAEMGLSLTVMWLPGHTLDHVGYVNENHLFCGDVLFSAGCGRLFEGTPAQMLQALTRLKQLPDTTQVYCAHEYTAKNIAFARTIEPDNVTLQAYADSVHCLRSKHLPTLPTSIGLERAINPFLRCDLTHIQAKFSPDHRDELRTFSALRTLRNFY